MAEELSRRNRTFGSAVMDGRDERRTHRAGRARMGAGDRRQPRRKRRGGLDRPLTDDIRGPERRIGCARWKASRGATTRSPLMSGDETTSANTFGNGVAHRLAIVGGADPGPSASSSRSASSRAEPYPVARKRAPGRSRRHSRRVGRQRIVGVRRLERRAIGLEIGVAAHSIDRVEVEVERKLMIDFEIRQIRPRRAPFGFALGHFDVKPLKTAHEAIDVEQRRIFARRLEAVLERLRATPRL